jgi:hypothetical protein
MPSPATSDVAVVMITHNRRDEVLRSLGHLTALPERPPIVLVDNGSTDGTAAAVAREFPRVEVIDAGGNRGAAGRNLGLRRVGTPYVALCDDDAWWEPGSLVRAAELFDRHPRLGVATARIVVGPENREDAGSTQLAASPLPAEPGMPGPPLLGFLAGPTWCGMRCGSRGSAGRCVAPCGGASGRPAPPRGTGRPGAGSWRPWPACRGCYGSGGWCRPRSSGASGCWRPAAEGRTDPCSSTRTSRAATCRPRCCA